MTKVLWYGLGCTLLFANYLAWYYWESAVSLFVCGWMAAALVEALLDWLIEPGGNCERQGR